MGRFKSGERYGKWTTLKIERVTLASGARATKWVVKCDCGTITSVRGSDLTNGKTTQCRKCYGTAPKDLSGKVFSEWTVIRLGEKKNGKTHWICRCSCGREENVCSASLINGVSTRCVKCYQKTMGTHGHTKKGKEHPLYNIWISMIARCDNPNHLSYKYYGGRGIKVCDRWYDLLSFAEDMGPRPKRLTIDRIDNNGNYEPSNCRWVTYKQNSRNKRSNRIIEYHGIKKCISEWAEFFNIRNDTFDHYMKRNGFEKAYKHFAKNSL